MTHELPERVWLEADQLHFKYRDVACRYDVTKSVQELHEPVAFRRPVELTPGMRATMTHSLLLMQDALLKLGDQDGLILSPEHLAEFSADIACLRTLLGEGAP